MFLQVAARGYCGCSTPMGHSQCSLRPRGGGGEAWDRGECGVCVFMGGGVAIVNCNCASKTLVL